MLKSVSLLAFIVLGFCLVSIVSAGCDYCSAEPEGGWGAPDYSNDPFWGMSVDDILNDYSSAAKESETTSELSDISSGSSYAGYGLSPSKTGSNAAGNFNWGSSGAGKFASLFESKSNIGDSKLISIKTAGTLKPEGDVVYDKALWQTLPATGPYCSTCAIKNATRAYNSVIKENYYANSPTSGFFFGGMGFDGGGGGACC